MKVMIIGYSGSGKSTLAQALGRRYDAPVLHLDMIHWLPGWQERPLAQEQAMGADFLDRNGSWVIDGNYTRLSYERRLEEADRIVLLCFGRFTCLRRAAVRYWRSRGCTRDSMAPGCPEKLDREFVWWILYRGRRKETRRRYQELAADYPDKLVRLTNQRQLDRYLACCGEEQNR